MTTPTDLPVAGNENLPLVVAAKVARRSPTAAALAAVFTTLPMTRLKGGAFTLFDRTDPAIRAARRKDRDQARTARANAMIASATAKRQARAEKRRRALEVDINVAAAREAAREDAYRASLEARRLRLEAKAQAKAERQARWRARGAR